mgnify:FL=1|jgi:hypothetical protein|tara:strand:- start:2808 stop:3056 length:249 start_codon:yes stop_codon:yes gene_type:complete
MNKIFLPLSILSVYLVKFKRPVLTNVREMRVMKKILLLLTLSIPFAQRLDPIDIAMQELRTAVETASRSSQKVFVEDFTGLN